MKESRRESLRSMTGYAVDNAEVCGGQLTLELRAVNSRYLDLNFRMSEDLRMLEGSLRQRIGEQVKRGKLECRVNFASSAQGALPAALNTELLMRLRTLAAGVSEAVPEARPLSVAEILRWPGMLGDTSPDMEALNVAALALLDRALEQFNASRAREGEKLRLAIAQRVDAMRTQIDTLRPLLPDIVSAYRDKLARRLEELLPTLDVERLHQEVALFAQKIDVAEELDRLLTHLGEVMRVLDAGSAAGKRLDFLMQELNREANTLGSKSVSLDLTRASVELKVLIEQMREQVQNIE